MRPYWFEGLEKVPRRHLQALQRIPAVLPGEILDGEIPDAAREALKKVFDADALLELDSICALSPGDLSRLVPDPTLLAVFSPVLGTRAVLEVELALAHAMVDRMLGAVGESPAARALTDIELGVLSYVLLEASRALAMPVPEGGLGRLRVEGVVGSAREGLLALQESAVIAVVAFRLVIGPVAGYLRVMIPEEALAARAAAPDASKGARARRSQALRSRLGRLAGVRVELFARIGRGELNLADLAGLRAGDVVVVDELSLRPDRGEDGAAVMKVGAGRAGGFEASVQLADGRYRATLTRFAPGLREELAGGAPEKERESLMADEAQDLSGEKLLGDVPLEVVVELGRVRISAEQLLDLHEGAVLDLGRGPGDAIALSVNGRVVARGALVEIEGRLGVRVASLSR